MKLICAIALALILSEAAAFSITRKNDGFEFDYSHFGNDSPIDLVLKGQYDVNDETKNEITAFLNLAGTMFPLFDTITKPQEKIEYNNYWCSGTGNFRICFGFNAHLIVGWTVNQVAVDDEYYNITYTPFVDGHASGSQSLESGYWKLSAQGWTKYLQF